MQRTMQVSMPMHMRADEDPIALTKHELDKKKAAPADKGNSASAGCDQCHRIVAVLYAVFVVEVLDALEHTDSLRGSVDVQSRFGQEEEAYRQCM